MEVMKAMLENVMRRNMAQVHVNARAAGVRLPQVLMGRPEVSLKLSWRFPDTDLRLTDDGISARLRFPGGVEGIFVPWGAVYGVGDPNACQGVELLGHVDTVKN